MAPQLALLLSEGGAPLYAGAPILPGRFPSDAEGLVRHITHQNRRLRAGILYSVSLTALLAVLLCAALWIRLPADCKVSSVAGGSPAGIVGSSLYDKEIAAEFGGLAQQILAEAEKGSAALYERLKELCFTFGARLSGQPALDDAIQWVKSRMEMDGLEEVRLQRVEGVSHWLRGPESLRMEHPRAMALSMVGLGGSVGGRVRADVMSVASFDELAARAAEAAGKIVLFNAPFTTYGETVAYRVRGAVAAAEAGAVAALVRSVSSFSMANPHTGAMSYASATSENVTRIPAAAVATEHADMIHWLLTSGYTVTLHLEMSGRESTPSLSHNVLAQLTGGSAPWEVVTVGGHLDSWDIGLGAMDDAAGVLVTWEAVRILKALGLKPRRTIRVVAFTNEEEGGVNGVLGGRVYAAELSNETHVMAIESDSGAFNPEGFYFAGSAAAHQIVSRLSATLLASLNATEVLNIGFSGTDVHPLTVVRRTAQSMHAAFSAMVCI